MRKRKMNWLGHVMRGGMKKVFQGKVRGIGREQEEGTRLLLQAIKWMEVVIQPKEQFKTAK